MLDDFNKRQRVIDLGEEAEDEKEQYRRDVKHGLYGDDEEEVPEETTSAFDTPQYRRVMQACKERNEIPTMAWTPDEEPDEFWDSLPDVVHSTDIEKKAVWRDDPNHPKYILNKKDTLTKDEAFNAIVEGMKILGWDKKEDE